MRNILSISLIILAGCLPAVGAPSGLNMIPTADVLDRGAMSLETESDGTGRPWSDDCDSFALFQFGVGGGVELGVDSCTNHPDAWVNCKWRIRSESSRLPAVALGVQALNYDGHTEPYAVATKTVARARFHAGLIGIESRASWMIGIDHPLSERVAFQADCIDGKQYMTALGIAIDLTDSLSLTLAKTLGHTDGTGDGHVVNLAWTATLK